MGVMPVGRDRQKGGGRIHMPLEVLRDPRSFWTMLMQLYEY